MALDTTLNNDDRGYGRGKEVARGQESKTLSIPITSGQTRGSGSYTMHGRLDALLVEVPDLGGVSTLNLEIYPADATADGTDTELRMVNINATLAKSKDYYIRVADYITGNLPVYVFGEHKIAAISSASVASNVTVKVIPILNNGG